MMGATTPRGMIGFNAGTSLSPPVACKAVLALHGPAAVAKMEDTAYDLVITDVRLTGETGDVLIERVGQVPVIVMTAYGSVSAAVDAMKRGAADYLSKPFTPQALDARIRSARRQVLDLLQCQGGIA